MIDDEHSQKAPRERNLRQAAVLHFIEGHISWLCNEHAMCCWYVAWQWKYRQGQMMINKVVHEQFPGDTPCTMHEQLFHVGHL